MTWATEKRRRQFDAEAEALGNPAKVGQHVPVGRGRRPYVKVSVTFSKVLTTRQREGRHGYMKLGRANGRIHEMARGEGRQMTMQEFVETLSPEELVRGRPRDKSGGFRGRPPTWVPHEFHRACIRELMRRGKEMWQVAYLEAIEAMTDIASGRGAAGKVATPGERIKAAQFVIERLEGRVPEVVKIESDQPWALVLDGIVADVNDDQINKGQKALQDAQSAKMTLEGEWSEGSSEPETPRPPVRSPRRRRTTA
jgi:hypothetical protein